MDRKKSIRLASIVFIVIVTLIVLEVSIRGINTAIVDYKEKKENQKNEEIYKNTEEYKEEIFLENVVTKFGELLNKRDIDSLYELVNEDYKNYRFNGDKEKFAKYIEKYFPSGENEYELQTYENLYGRYLCRFLTFDKSNYASYKLIVTPKKNDTYDVMFDGIDTLTKLNGNISQKGNINYSLLYMAKQDGKYMYMVELENKEASEKEYQYESVVLKNTRGDTYVFNVEGRKITLKPAEKTRCEYVFDGEKIGLYDHASINIDLIETSTGRKLNIPVYINEY